MAGIEIKGLTSSLQKPDSAVLLKEGQLTKRGIFTARRYNLDATFGWRATRLPFSESRLGRAIESTKEDLGLQYYQG